MAKKKTFRVYAKVITYCYIDIEAKTKEEAEEEAEEMDGADFISDEVEDGGDFIVSPEEKPTKEV